MENRTLLSPPEFLGLFSGVELERLRFGRSDNRTKAVLAILDDPRTNAIDIASGVYPNFIDYLTKVRIISAERADEIREGVPVRYRTAISPVEFKMLFTPSERITIRMAREYSGDDASQRHAALVIDDWFDILDDPRLSSVDLSLSQTRDGLDFLVSVGVLTGERRAEIGLGVAEVA